MTAKLPTVLTFALSAACAVGGPAEQSGARFVKSFSGCTAAESPAAFYGVATNVLAILPPVLEPLNYKWNGSDFVAPKGKGGSIESGVLTEPQHGSIKRYEEANRLYEHLYWYEAKPDYRGIDSIVFWVKIGHEQYRLNLQVHVVGSVDSEPHCERRATNRQGSNTSIERTTQGKPWVAAHVER